jgi:hypothetical protein
VLLTCVEASGGDLLRERTPNSGDHDLSERKRFLR